MRAKQKAADLVDIYIPYADWSPDDTENGRVQQARNCALICVNQIIREVTGKDRVFWMEVANELDRQIFEYEQYSKAATAKLANSAKS